MNRSSLAYLFIGVLSVLFVGCYESHCAPGAPFCGSDSDARDASTDIPCDGDGDTQLYRVQILGVPEFLGEFVDGFNLDDHVSRVSDPEGCFIEDFRSPSGLPGIDNIFSQVVSVLEAATRRPMDIGGSIALTISDIDSYRDDSCVVVTSDEVHRGSIRGGVLRVEGIDVSVELESEVARFRDGILEADITESSLTGIAGGSVDEEDFERAIERFDAVPDPRFPPDLFDTVSDMGSEGGICQRVSGAFTIESR